MSNSKVVLPPANGKKLWRVKRTISSSNTNNNNNTTTNNNSQSKSNSHSSISTSNECLNNSLKIAAAAAKFTIKRPPLRRPKNKPGKPKDFVFVDLSPIKSEDLESEKKQQKEKSKTTTTTIAPQPQPQVLLDHHHHQLPSPTLSDDTSIFDSLNSITGFEDLTETSTTTTESSSHLEGLGLGIMNLGINFDQPQPIQQQPQQDFYSQQLYGYQQAMLQQHLQIQQLQQQLLEQQRKNSDSSRPLPTQLQSPFQEPSQNSINCTAGQFQFKNYPYQQQQQQQPKKHLRSISESCIKKPQLKKHHRSMSIPMTPMTSQPPKQDSQFYPQPQQMGLSDSVSTDCSDVSLDDFMMLNDQIQMNLSSTSSSSFTPISDYSDEEIHKQQQQQQQQEFTNFTIDEFLVQQTQLKNEEFELNSYLHI